MPLLDDIHRSCYDGFYYSWHRLAFQVGARLYRPKTSSIFVEASQAFTGLGHYGFEHRDQSLRNGRVLY